MFFWEQDFQVDTDSGNRNSKISSWTTVTKSAMSLEEFSEYFVARVVRDDFPRGIGTEYKDIGINIVQAICALHTPRMYYTQVGEFDIQLRIDHAGFCIPAPKGAISEIYVLSAHHTSDAEWKGYQKVRTLECVEMILSLCSGSRTFANRNHLVRLSSFKVM